MTISLKNVTLVIIFSVVLTLSIDKYYASQYIDTQSNIIDQQNILITKQQNYIDKLKEKLNNQVEQNKNILQGLDYVGKVKATTYYPVEGQTDNTPLITASGKKINPNNATRHRWIAVSRDLHSRWGGPLSFGDRVYITGAGSYNGYYIVHDTMNRRWNDRIDILQTEGDPIFSFNDVDMFIVDKNDTPMYVEQIQ